MVDYYVGHGTYDAEGMPTGIIGRKAAVNAPRADMPDFVPWEEFKARQEGREYSAPDTAEAAPDPEREATVANVVDTLADWL